MITTASMFASMGLTSGELGFHRVYLATAIGSGPGLAELETLKTWSIMPSVVGLASMTMTLVYSFVLPMT